MTVATPIELAPPTEPLAVAARGGWPRATALALAVAALALPPLLMYAHRLGRDGLVPVPLAIVVTLAAIALAVRDTRQLGALEAGAGIWSWVWLSLSLLVLAVSGCFMVPSLGAVSLQVLLLALAQSRGGPRLVRAVLPAWGLLWFLVPPVPWLLDRVDARLLASAGREASDVLEWQGVYHLTRGELLRVDDWALWLGTLRDGWCALVVVLSLASIHSVVRRHSVFRWALFLIAGVGWTWLALVVRVLTLALAWAWRGTDLREGWSHDLVGAGLLVTVLGLLLSTDVVVGVVVAGVRTFVSAWARAWRTWRRERAVKRALWEGPALTPEDFRAEVGQTIVAPAAPAVAMPTAWPSLKESVLGRPVVIAALAVVGLGLGAWLAPALVRAIAPKAGFPQGAFERLGLESMPATLGPCRRLGFEAEDCGPGASAGAFRRSWRYTYGPHDLLVTVAFPFAEGDAGDHVSRLQGDGWTVKARAAREDVAESLLELDLVDRDGTPGWFAQGRRDAPDRPARLSVGPKSLGERLAVWREPTRRWLIDRMGQPDGYVVQLLATCDGPLPDRARADLRRFLDEFHATLKSATDPAGTRGPS